MRPRSATPRRPSRRARGSDRPRVEGRRRRCAPLRERAPGSACAIVGGRHPRRQGEPLRGRRRSCGPTGSTGWSPTTRRRCSRSSRQGCGSARSGRCSRRAGRNGPSDAPDDATVGGTIAAGASSPRRLRVGRVRDTVVEMELVTGDGRLVRSGARTVKSVPGLRPAPARDGLARDARCDRPGRAEGPAAARGRAGRSCQPRRRARARPAAARRGPAPLRDRRDARGGVEVALEGWPEEVEEQTAAIRSVVGPSRSATTSRRETRRRGDRGADRRRGRGRAIASRCGPRRRDDWRRAHRASARRGSDSSDGRALAALRRRVAEAGGIAPVIRGPGGLGDTPGRRAGGPPTAQGRVRPGRDPRARAVLGRALV